MRIFEIIIALLIAGAALSALARRIGAPYPALVALAGALLAVLPGTPVLLLDPSLALALFVAPVLLDAAFDASPRDLRRNWRPVAGLAIGAVALTVAAVAAVAHALVPDLRWAPAIALGSIVAPPDAAAATAVLKQLRPPHRLMVILEGESLFNDASALLLFRLAVGATVAGAAALQWNLASTIVLATAGSVLLGLIASRIVLFWGARVHEVSTAVILQFSSTFGVWLLAERLHLSGILTMVVYAMATARVASDIVPARVRVPSYAVWEVAVFVLNVLAFILVGLQLKPIVSALNEAALVEYLLVAAAVCGTAIAARLVWVMAVGALGEWWCTKQRRVPSESTDLVALSPRASVLIGWCGMRGIVTLASALALPAGGDGSAPFPHRDLILFTSFAVVLGTLVVQGLTLGPLMKRLGLNDDGAVEHEVQLARVESLRAGLQVTTTSAESEAILLMRRRYELRLRRANVEQQESGNGVSNGNGLTSTDDFTVVRNAIAAERQRLLDLRAAGTIGDEAFQRVEQELDFRELEFEQFF